MWHVHVHLHAHVCVEAGACDYMLLLNVSVGMVPYIYHCFQASEFQRACLYCLG